jgi:hypothetical protein
MPLKYDKPKGKRFKRYFIGIYVRTTYPYWYNNDLKKWEHVNKVRWDLYEYSNYVKCNTIRAFRRHLRKNKEMKGKLMLVNRYIGYDAYG